MSKKKYEVEPSQLPTADQLAAEMKRLRYRDGLLRSMLNTVGSLIVAVAAAVIISTMLLPVQAEWSYPNLKTAPCRYVGNFYENDLILCAHNYTTHFGRIGRLHTDDPIVFTDVHGQEHRFSVINIEQLPGTAVEEMQFGNADDWDLTLFTCTLGGQSRVTVRAVRAEEGVQ